MIDYFPLFVDGVNIKSRTVTIFYAFAACGQQQLLITPFFFLIGCDVHLFILKELRCSGDLTLHGPRGWLNATGLSGEEPGWKQNVSARRGCSNLTGLGDISFLR